MDIYRGTDLKEFHLKDFGKNWTLSLKKAKDEAFKNNSAENHKVVLKSKIDKDKVYHFTNNEDLVIEDITVEFLNNISIVSNIEV